VTAYWGTVANVNAWTSVTLTGDIGDPLSLQVLDANGNPEPNATIQTNFGTSSPVPEPATYGMMGLGLIALATIGKRLAKLTSR
jgi:hypothetical protein